MENFYFNLHQEFLDTRLMRAFLSKYLRDNGYYCCDVFFAQVRFKPETKPKCFDNSLGYNLVYETIAYRPKSGWSWEKLVKDWYANIEKGSEPDDNLLSIIKYTPYDKIYPVKSSSSYKEWSESSVSLNGKLEVIKVYFDVMSGQICFRDYAKTERNDVFENCRKLDVEKVNNFYRWMSCDSGDEYNRGKKKYEDSWYEECIYEPDCFNFGVVNLYKITHEPYYEKQYQFFDGKKYNEKRLINCDVQASSLLSLLEIIQYLYWHVYHKNPKEKNYDIDSYVNINEPSGFWYDKERDFFYDALGSIETDSLWIDRFINPSTQEYPNRALFYTTNVLELTTEMKIEFSKEISALRKDLSELTCTTALAVHSITYTVKNIYMRIFEQRAKEIRLKLIRFPYDKESIAAWFDVVGICQAILEENPYKPSLKTESRIALGTENIIDLRGQAVNLEQKHKNFEQKYLLMQNKILQIEQNLQNLKQLDRLPTLEELQKMQKLLD